MEETEQEGNAGYNFSTKNGKEAGKAGRPSKDFLEQKQALETIQAIEKSIPGFFEHFVQRYQEGREQGNSKRSPKTGKGFIQRLVNDPLVGALGNVLKPFGSWAAVLGGLWVAEEYVKLPVRNLREIEVDDLTKPITERVQKFENVRELDANNNLITVRKSTGYETKIIGYKKKKKKDYVTTYVDFPPLLHTVLDILKLLLPLLSQALTYLGGSLQDYIKTGIKDYETLTDGEFNSEDAKALLHIISPISRLLFK